MDGDGKRNSTNGTWFFASDLFEIHDNMIFKAGTTVFQVVFRQARIVADFNSTGMGSPHSPESSDSPDSPDSSESPDRAQTQLL
jgi:hypothetical protein